MDLRNIRPHWPLFLKTLKESSHLLDSHNNPDNKATLSLFPTYKAQKALA